MRVPLITIVPVIMIMPVIVPVFVVVVVLVRHGLTLPTGPPPQPASVL